MTRYSLLGLILVVASSSSLGAPRIVHEEKDGSDDFVFEVQPRLISPGEVAVLRWSIKGATRVVIEERTRSSRELHKVGAFTGNGSLSVRPTEDTIYVLTCEGLTKYSCASVSVRVREKQR